MFLFFTLGKINLLRKACRVREPKAFWHFKNKGGGRGFLAKYWVRESTQKGKMAIFNSLYYEKSLNIFWRENIFHILRDCFKTTKVDW